MVLAYHTILTAYGFWLPNDPRGSWSDFVAAWELVLAGGKATKVDTRRSVAWDPHDREARLRAKEALRFPPVEFDGTQARAVGRGFAKACEETGYVIRACSILPAHVHLVVGRHERKIEVIAKHLKSRATQWLRKEGIDPMAGCFRPDGVLATPWAEKSWSVYLDSESDIRRAVKYVEENPPKERKTRQRWSFVEPYV